MLKHATKILCVVAAFAILTGGVCSLASAQKDPIDGTIAISGYIKDGNDPLSGVTMKAKDSTGNIIAQTTSSQYGFYSLAISTTFASFMVVPAKEGYFFNPSMRTYSSSGGNKTNQNYAVTSLIESATLLGVKDASVDWGDFDNDGRLDLTVIGQEGQSDKFWTIYYNKSTAVQTSFTLDHIITGDVLVRGKIACLDYNNDGNLDVIMTGDDGPSPYQNHYCARLRKNTGNGLFVDVQSDFFRIYDGGLFNSTLAVGDFDHDGWVDVAIAGEMKDGPNKNKFFLKVFRNNKGTFELHSQLLNAGVHCGGIAWGSLAWGDYDRDGDLDLAVTGRYNHFKNNWPWNTWTYTDVTKIFNYNSQNKLFSELSGTNFIGVEEGAVVWADFNNDGDLDLAIAGNNANNGGGSVIGKTLRIYKNGKNGNFSLYAALPGVRQASLSSGDYNNDGKIDLAVSGLSANGRICKVYKNKGSGSFEDIGTNLPGVSVGTLSWGDYNNDGKLDLASTGMLDSTGTICNVYKNLRLTANTPPQPPAQLEQAIYPLLHMALLKWSQGFDVQTNFQGLSYNLCVGTNPVSCDVVGPMSIVNGSLNGKRTVSALGPVVHKLEPLNYWILSGLQDGATYYWKVQAIDPGLMGSTFSVQKSFTVPAKGKLGK